MWGCWLQSLCMPPHKLRSILHFCLPHPFFRDFCLSVPHLFFGSLSFSVSHSFFRTLPFQRLSPLLRILFFSISYSLFRTLPLKCPLHLLRIPSFSVSHPFPPLSVPHPFSEPFLSASPAPLSESSFHYPSPLFQNPALSMPLTSFPAPSLFNVSHLPFFFPLQNPPLSVFPHPFSQLSKMYHVARKALCTLYDPPKPYAEVHPSCISRSSKQQSQQGLKNVCVVKIGGRQIEPLKQRHAHPVVGNPPGRQRGQQPPLAVSGELAVSFKVVQQLLLLHIPVVHPLLQTLAVTRHEGHWVCTVVHIHVLFLPVPYAHAKHVWWAAFTIAVADGHVNHPLQWSFRVCITWDKKKSKNSVTLGLHCLRQQEE